MKAPAVRGRLINTAEAASLLGVNRKTVTNWCRGSCPPISYRIVGGGYKFDTADIDDYLSAVYVAAGSGQRRPA